MVNKQHKTISVCIFCGSQAGNDQDFAKMAAKAHASLNPEELNKAVTAFRSTFEEQMSILAILIDSAFAE